MSLDFDVSKIENYQELTTAERNGTLRWHPVTEAIVYLSLTVQLQKITKENWRKWFTRARLYEKAFGTMLLSRGTEGEGLLPDALYITPEEVKAHIGLTTNVYPDKTDAQWRKEFMESWEREVEWRILKEKND